MRKSNRNAPLSRASCCISLRKMTAICFIA
jgi:hypothetical protein